jgi:hypothetical protein
MVIVIQHISTHWTKASRSGPGAKRRSSVPDALPLPFTPDPASELTLVKHTVRYDEEDGFATPHQDVAIGGAVEGRVERFRCVQVRVVDGRAGVVYAWEPSQGGAPPRSTYHRQVLDLAAGEWGRVTYNGRHSALSGMSGWWYRQDVVNVAVLQCAVQEPFAGAPSREFSDLAHLR